MINFLIATGMMGTSSHWEAVRSDDRIQLASKALEGRLIYLASHQLHITVGYIVKKYHRSYIAIVDQFLLNQLHYKKRSCNPL